MASSVKKIQVSKVGACLKVLVVNAVKPNAHEVYTLSNIKSVKGSFQAGVGRNGIANPSTYSFTDRKTVTVEFGDDLPSLTFDLETVTNQAGWTLNLAGVIQAITDINSWITDAVTPSGGATEVTVAAILTAQATEAKQDDEIEKLNDALGGNGTEFIFGTGAVTAKTYKYLVANEDCTFTTLTGSVTADLKAALGITTNTVSKGMIIRGLNGETIKDITMLTGSVIGVR